MNKGNLFLEELRENIIIGDGAYGTEFIARGCTIKGGLERLNLINPAFVENLHREYIAAGSRFIETNTFQANRINLARYGAEKDYKDIISQGVLLAKKSAYHKENIYIAGSLGPIPSMNGEPVSLTEQKDLFSEQIEILCSNGVDIILFETFTRLDELLGALNTAKSITDIPVITQIVFEYDGTSPDGTKSEIFYQSCLEAGADVIGTNCGDGVPAVVNAVKQIRISECPVSAFFNAGFSEHSEGRHLFLASPEYLADNALSLAHMGVRLIGGCCGTNPYSIKAISNILKSIDKHTTIKISYPQRKKEKKDTQVRIEPVIPEGICVELDPPRNSDVKPVIQAAQMLTEKGICHITIADNPLASVRMDVISIAGILKRETNTNIIPHLTCRDRNRIALRSAVLGANAQGICSILCITGDPVKMYHESNTTGVFDVNSIGLIKIINDINKSEQIKNPIAIGAACNPNVRYIEGQISKLKRKMDSGVHFILTQPVYDLARVERFFEYLQKENMNIPVFIGIFPLTSAKIAEYLHNEVPGIVIPQDIRNRLNQYEQVKDQRLAAEEIILKIISEYYKVSKNFYLVTPKNKVNILIPIIDLIHKKKRKAE